MHNCLLLCRYVIITFGPYYLGLYYVLIIRLGHLFDHDSKVTLQILERKFYKSTKKSSLISQRLLIFIHITPVVENYIFDVHKFIYIYIYLGSGTCWCFSFYRKQVGFCKKKSQERSASVFSNSILALSFNIFQNL